MPDAPSDGWLTAASVFGSGVLGLIALSFRNYVKGKLDDPEPRAGRQVILEQAELRSLGELPEQLRLVSGQLREVYDVERTNRDALAGLAPRLDRIESIEGENNKILRKLELEAEVEQRIQRVARSRDDADRTGR